ncbi:MAG: Fe-S cluster assembly protein SufD [Paracoccaceae bacterium]|jgi:Fe-S cluster assembly protein SufD
MALPQQKIDMAETLLSRHSTNDATGWATLARTEAAARLRSMGAPVRRDEYWRYTDPSALTGAVAAATALTSDAFTGVDALRVVFVDGALAPDLSDPLAMEGVEIASLADAMAADIHWASGLFGVLEGGEHHRTPRPLAALNTAVASQGLCIRVTGTPVRPIVIDQRRTDGTVDAVLHHVIKVEAGAEVTILEIGDAGARTNTCMEIDVAANARLHHLRAQGPGMDRIAATHVFARLGADCVYKSFTLSVDGALTRNEHVIQMNGDDAKAHVAGAVIGDGKMVHDDTVFVTHDALRCESRQVYKKVLKSGARGVFQGKIWVKAGAQKTDGYQISQALLLTDDTEFDAKPELEIYADDVICSHGSTVGAADETQLFYLRSRGVSLEAAQGMIVLAFLAQALEEIENEALSEEIRASIAMWALGGAEL